MSNLYYMKTAIYQADCGIENGDGGPFGCVIVKGNKIVAVGHNEVIKTNDVTAHGEMQAIRQACKNLNTFDLTGCELYTTGYPCPMCMAAIKWANIKKVYYGCNTTDTEQIGFRDKLFEETDDNNLVTLIECERDECLKLYEKYKNKTNKINY